MYIVDCIFLKNSGVRNQNKKFATEKEEKEEYLNADYADDTDFFNAKVAKNANGARKKKILRVKNLTK